MAKKIVRPKKPTKKKPARKKKIPKSVAKAQQAKKALKKVPPKPLAGKGVNPSQAITHILRHKKLGRKYKDRVDSIISHFPKANIIDIEKDSGQRVLEKIHELFPGIAGSSAKAVSASKRILVIGRASNNTLVAPFESEKDLVCPRFYKIVPMSNGCIYNCEYCYLQATYRAKLPYIKMNVNWESLVAQMKKVVAKEKEKGRNVYFNMGELMDSLSFDAVTGFLPFLMEQLESKDFDGSEPGFPIWNCQTGFPDPMPGKSRPSTSRSRSIPCCNDHSYRSLALESTFFSFEFNAWSDLFPGFPRFVNLYLGNGGIISKVIFSLRLHSHNVAGVEPQIFDGL